MLFNSLDFLIFFPIVLLVYYVIPNKIKNLWLLVASYYFYMCWNAKYAILILASTFITYVSGLAIERWKYKKIVVALSFISNLSILFFFKYTNFVIELINGLSNSLHIMFNVPSVDILLPVGISFYTFQALSYTMDVYRKEIYAERNFINYALFVSFFPQLVAGPIERSKNLLKQLAVPRRFDYDLAREGLLLMIWGYFLKIVLASRLAIFVDTVYRDYEKFGGAYLIIATMLFAVLVYCDFAGYSTIAMGAAQILGIKLMDNFNAPYLAGTVAEFWRRWHISLTSWFKDYLYIPLGGNRKGTTRKYINKMIVFLVSGLWHGANMTFIVWGGLNGLYQVIGEITLTTRRSIKKVLGINEKSTGYKIISILITFMLVDFSWIFFRASSYADAINIIKSIFSVHNPWILFDGSLYTCGLDYKNFGLMIVCIIILLIADVIKHKGIQIRKRVLEQDWWFRCLFFASAIILVLLFGKWGPNFQKDSFIYFQF